MGIGEAVEFVLDMCLGPSSPAPDNDDSWHVDQTPSVILPETSAYSEVRELSAYEKYGPTHPVNWQGDGQGKGEVIRLCAYSASARQGRKEKSWLRCKVIRT